MGSRAVHRAYPDVHRSAIVPHTPLRTDRWTGVLKVEWTFDRDRPLVVGAGWYSLRGGATQPDQRPKDLPRRVGRLREEPLEILAEIVRLGSDGQPVLPGSSIKGAVRQIFELLTPSCHLARGQACKVAVKESHPRVCPACSLFGAPGLGGRLAFGEAKLATENWKLQVIRVKTPTAWPPRKWVEGTTRVYDQRTATTLSGNEAPAEESTWALWGTLQSKIRLVNASEEELGLLFAALGLGARKPMIRLGGKKYHGFGGANVRLLEATQIHPTRAELSISQVSEWAGNYQERWVRQVPARQTAWEELHTALAALDRGGTNAHG